MADGIAVLDAGHIVQIGTPDDIYDRPATTFVATLVGTPRINLVPAARENGSLYVRDSAIRLPLGEGVSVPQMFLLGVRPEDVKPSAQGDLRGEVVLTEPLGVETVIHIRSEGQTLLSIVPGITDLAVGDPVQFEISQERLHYFDLDGQRV
jgi:multiple sugar transport system ATP-binding protein